MSSGRARTSPGSSNGRSTSDREIELRPAPRPAGLLRLVFRSSTVPVSLDTLSWVIGSRALKAV